MKYALCGRMVDVIGGHTIEDGAVLVDGERICYAGERAGAPDIDSYKVISAQGGTILPGFIDCHAHLMGFPGNSVHIPEAVLALKAAKDMKDLLNSGFTAVRDMTRISPHLKKAVDQGWCSGPRISAGSQVIGITSGHTDNVAYPLADAVDTPIGYLCDGREGCLRAVRLQFRRGAEFIKICATGGVSSMADELDDIQFSKEEIQVMVDEASRRGTYVAAHCSGVAGTKQALQCGVKTIEHGIDLDDECIELMKEGQCSLVTTLYISLNVGEMEDLPDWLRAKGRQCAEKNKRSITKVHKAGINIALGTDFSNDGPEMGTDFSFIGREFEAITQCGFTPMEAIQIGTINGAVCMGWDKSIGSLTAGKYADIVICAGNPADDIKLLGSCENITFVMKNGTIEKCCFNSKEL